MENEVVNNNKEMYKSVRLLFFADLNLVATSGFCVLTNRHDAGISRNCNSAKQSKKDSHFVKAFSLCL